MLLDKLRKIGYFLRIIDNEPRLDLPDLAFMIILGKIIVAQHVDWTAMVTLSTVALNTMHNRQTKIKSQDMQDMTDKLSGLENKISPILDRVKQL